MTNIIRKLKKEQKKLFIRYCLYHNIFSNKTTVFWLSKQYLFWLGLIISNRLVDTAQIVQNMTNSIFSHSAHTYTHTSHTSSSSHIFMTLAPAFYSRENNIIRIFVWRTTCVDRAGKVKIKETVWAFILRHNLWSRKSFNIQKRSIYPKLVETIKNLFGLIVQETEKCKFYKKRSLVCVCKILNIIIKQI